MHRLIRSKMIVVMAASLLGGGWVAPAAAVEKFAAIEIGGSNVKYVRLNVDVAAREFVLPPEDEDNKVENPGLAAELGDDGSGLLDEGRIAEAANYVADFVRILTNTKGVPREHIAVIGSSGLVDAVNRLELAHAIWKKTGISMDFVDAENEVRFTLLGVVPEHELYAALLVDIGSSNTKWGHLRPASNEAGYTMVAAHISSGSKTLSKSIDNQVGEFAKPAQFLQAVHSAMNERIKPELREQTTSAGMNPHDKVYISGGAVWAMVTLAKPESALQEYVRLTKEDFQRYSDRLTTDKARLFNVDYPSSLSAEVRERAEDDLRTVGKIFSPEQIVSGGHILLAFVEEFDWGSPKKEIYFARSGYKAWISGYVKEFARKKLKLAPTRPRPVSPLATLQEENRALRQLLLTRQWSDVRGRMATATLAGCEHGQVFLESAAGKIFPMPVEQLDLAGRRLVLDLAQRDAAAILAIPLPQLRTWTAAGGGKRVEAALLERSGDQVRLIRSDGHIFTVSAALLSTADQDFLAATQ